MDEYIKIYLNSLLGLSLQGQMALATVLTVAVLGHEDSGSAALSVALLAKTGDLAIGINLVVLENG